MLPHSVSILPHLLSDGRVNGDGHDTGKDAPVEGCGKGGRLVDTVDQSNLGEGQRQWGRGHWGWGSHLWVSLTLSPG